MILIDVIHHDVTYLHDILLLVVLAIHSVVNHHTYDLNIVRVVERIKNFQVNQHYYSDHILDGENSNQSDTS